MSVLGLFYSKSSNLALFTMPTALFKEWRAIRRAAGFAYSKQWDQTLAPEFLIYFHRMAVVPIFKAINLKHPP